MEITFNETDLPFEAKNGWHLLTVADPGYSAVTYYGEIEYGIDKTDLDRFIDKTNRLNEAGSLYPKAPLSAIPCKYIRELSNSTDLSILNEFKTHIEEFLTTNSKAIKTRNLAIDFRVTSESIPQHYIDATIEVLNEHNYGELENVIIY